MAAKPKDSSTLEIPMVQDLGVDRPIPAALRDRLGNDLAQAQVIAISIKELVGSELSGEGSKAESAARLTAIDAMAYQIGRLLEHWSGTGYFGDETERRIAEVCHE